MVNQVVDFFRIVYAPPQKRLAHGIDLIVVRPVGERGAFLDETGHPGRPLWVGQIDIAGLDLGTDVQRGRTLIDQVDVGGGGQVLSTRQARQRSP